MAFTNTIITGTGCYIPTEVITNPYFSGNQFYGLDNEPIDLSHDEITEKFVAITGISERRWVSNDLHASDIAAIAARQAVSDAGIDPEQLDQIIVAHDFGDIIKGNIQSDMLPSLAARVKHKLGITNVRCVAHDIIFGCPGWIQGIIHADSYIRSGMSKKVLVIGTETLSRLIDIYDRDSMIYSDGAGAAILEPAEEDVKRGVLSYIAESYTKEEAYYLYFGKSNIAGADPKVRYIKMLGRKIYEFSLKYVPAAIKYCLDKAGLHISDVAKILIHQANEKMDQEILKRLFRMYGLREVREDIMPMSIQKLGNNSVATVPTLLDLIRKESYKGHNIRSGDVVVFASVGAGMNINAVAYRF